MSRLEASGLHIRHPGADRDSVRDLHLTVEPGEILCLVGPNGSGKSTTLAGLAREIRPRVGQIQIDGNDIWTVPRRQFAKLLARLPQEPQCPEGLTVEDVVGNGRSPYLGTLGGWKDTDRHAVQDAIEAMDLVDLKRRAVETLSGGERRRVWLAMVLCQGSDILLLDEPTSALDLRHQLEVLALLADINRTRGVSMIVVMHDLEQAARLGHRLAVLYRGRLYDTAPPDEVLRSEMLLDVFRVAAEIRGRGGSIEVDVLEPADPMRSL